MHSGGARSEVQTASRSKKVRSLPWRPPSQDAPSGPQASGNVRTLEDCVAKLGCVSRRSFGLSFSILWHGCYRRFPEKTPARAGDPCHPSFWQNAGCPPISISRARPHEPSRRHGRMAGPRNSRWENGTFTLQPHRELCVVCGAPRPLRLASQKLFAVSGANSLSRPADAV
jgi:hypothetical protein